MLTYLSKQSIVSRKDGSTGKPRNLVIWTALSDLSSVEHGKHTIKTKQSNSQKMLLNLQHGLPPPRYQAVYVDMNQTSYDHAQSVRSSAVAWQRF